MRFSWILPLALSIAPASGFADQAGRLDNAATVLHELRATPTRTCRASCGRRPPGGRHPVGEEGGVHRRRRVRPRRDELQRARPLERADVPHARKRELGLSGRRRVDDLVLLMMNRGGVDKLLANKVSLGADASAAAGPLGRSAHAATDAQMKAEILSVLARARGSSPASISRGAC